MIGRIKKSIDTHAKSRGRIYIVPTQTGLLFIGVNFTLFLMGMVYANNLVLLLTFALFAALLLTMFQTHSILEGYEPGRVSFIDAHQDQGSSFTVQNRRDLVNYDIHTANSVCAGVPTDSRGPIRLKAPRGRYISKYIKSWTRGERGFFYVWTYRPCQGLFYVYPSLIPEESLNSSALREKNFDSGEFEKHGPYGAGVSAKRIDWKVFARSEQLMVKNFEDQSPGGILIDQKSFEGDKEQVLSKMAWQVEQALRMDAAWEMRGEGFFISSGKGRPHWRASMEALSEA